MPLIDRLSNYKLLMEAPVCVMEIVTCLVGFKRSGTVTMLLKCEQ